MAAVMSASSSALSGRIIHHFCPLHIESPTTSLRLPSLGQ